MSKPSKSWEDIYTVQTAEIVRQDAEIETLRERVKELKALVRQLAIKFKYSEPPHGLISAAADMYPYIKGEILQKADRVLDGVLEL